MSESRDLPQWLAKILQETKLGRDALEDAEFHDYLLCNNHSDQESLCQAKLIHSLSSGIFENHMRAGGHFSYQIKTR